MNAITSYQSGQLPDTLEDLTQFVLVGKSKLNAYMLKLQKVNRISTAQEIRDQTLQEAQEISTALIAAEQRIGELLLAIPKASGGDRKSDDFKNANNGNFERTKAETAKEMGYSHAEVRDYQQMAKHPEVVQKVMEEAIANGEVITKSQVMKEIAEAKRKAKEEVEAENAKLRAALSESETRRIKAEKNQEPKEVVKEVTVEVIPDDYEDLKEKAKHAESYQKDFKRMRDEYEKMADKWKQSEAEKKSILDEIHKPENEKAENIRRSALFFCAGVSNFIEKYGGYVWLTQEINNMDKSDREGYARAVNAMEAWVRQMKNNLGEE